jgi:hypothetical protein
MSNAERKARKKAGIKFERTPKTPTGRLGKPSYDLPVLPLGLIRYADSMWVSRSFR